MGAGGRTKGKTFTVRRSLASSPPATFREIAPAYSSASAPAGVFTVNQTDNVAFRGTDTVSRFSKRNGCHRNDFASGFTGTGTARTNRTSTWSAGKACPAAERRLPTSTWTSSKARIAWRTKPVDSYSSRTANSFISAIRSERGGTPRGETMAKVSSREITKPRRRSSAVSFVSVEVGGSRASVHRCGSGGVLGPTVPQARNCGGGVACR